MDKSVLQCNQPQRIVRTATTISMPQIIPMLPGSHRFLENKMKPRWDATCTTAMLGANRHGGASYPELTGGIIATSSPSCICILELTSAKPSPMSM